MWMNRLCGRLTSILILTPFLIFAQTPQKASNWYFGQEAGLNFQNGAPTPLSNGVMNSFEGTAVANDDNGQLLFYSNGGPGSPNNYFGGVWNNNHQLMPNGDLTNAGGCNSSLQSSLVLNHPRNPNTHYLFTTDCMENNAQGGLRYSVIDMRMDGGLGDVAASGVLLTDSVDESLTAIRHANGEDYWVVAHKLNTDTFHVYHLTGKGIAGYTSMAVGPSTGTYAGALKASSDGERLVYAGESFTYLFRFNNKNGAITDPIDLDLNGGYTAEFSPDCEMLYVANSFGKELYQYNLIFPNPVVSKTLVATTAATGLGAMQLGPDGKIYISRLISGSYLAVINEPNKSGSNCDFQDLGLFLGGRQNNAGLPNFPNDFVGDCASREINNNPLGANINGVNAVVNSSGIHSVNLSLIENSSNLINTVFYRAVGSNNWLSTEVSNSEITLENLEPETEYQIRVFSENMQPNGGNYKELDGHDLEDVVNNGLEPDISGEELFARTQSAFDISVFPNPTRERTSIAIRNTSGVKANYNITVYSAEGKQIVNRMEPVDGNYRKIELDLNELPGGIYQVIVNSNKISKSQKLVIMK